MSISPFSARPAAPDSPSPQSERRRARIVIMIVAIGICATLLAYGISPGVRHVVGHAAHSVKHVIDPDSPRRAHHGHPAKPAAAPPSRHHP